MCNKKTLVVISSLFFTLFLLTLTGCGSGSGSDELTRSSAEKEISKYYPQPISEVEVELFLLERDIPGSAQECLFKNGYLEVNLKETQRIKHPYSPSTIAYKPTLKMEPYLDGDSRLKIHRIFLGTTELDGITGISTPAGFNMQGRADIKKVDFDISHKLNEVGDCFVFKEDRQTPKPWTMVRVDEKQHYAIFQKYDDGWRLSSIGDKDLEKLKKIQNDLKSFSDKASASEKVSSPPKEQDTLKIDDFRDFAKENNVHRIVVANFENEYGGTMDMIAELAALDPNAPSPILPSATIWYKKSSDMESLRFMGIMAHPNEDDLQAKMEKKVIHKCEVMIEIGMKECGLFAIGDTVYWRP